MGLEISKYLEKLKFPPTSFNSLISSNLDTPSLDTCPETMLNNGNLTLTFFAYNRSLILHCWMKVTVLCYSLLNY